MIITILHTTQHNTHNIKQNKYWIYLLSHRMHPRCGEGCPLSVPPQDILHYLKGNKNKNKNKNTKTNENKIKSWKYNKIGVTFFFK